MAELSQSALEEALREVIDPVFDKPMSEVGTLKDLRVEEGVAKIRVRLVSPSEEVKAKAEEALKEAGIRDDLIVLVGGAPLNEAFAEDIGADAYCRDAAVAVETAKKFMAIRNER